MNKNPYNGFINIYKEQGFTSMDVCAKLRGILGMRKIGHAGTLDPMAEGVLPVALGRATKDIDRIGNGTKVYRAVMLLGVSTDTQDITGTIIVEKEVPEFSDEEIRAAADSFLGTYMQLTPMYSARKVAGKKLYEYARKGIEVERKKKAVEILSIVIEDISLPRVTFTVTCTKGTYIRTLCSDMGDRLGPGACMEELTRLAVGDIRIDTALKLSDVERLRDEGRIGEVLWIASGCAVALGKFDGAHMGHERIFRKLMTEAQRRRLRTCVIMLDLGDGYIIQRDEVKRELLSMGMDYVIRLRLGKELMAVSADDFLKKMLMDRYGMKVLVAGEDVTFGYKKEGNVHFLEANKEKYGYNFIPVEKLRLKNGEAISSTLIKRIITVGGMEEAEQLLGKSWSVTGTVVHGRHIGTSVLGFPTMNLEMPKELICPPFGVYAVRLSFLDRDGGETETYDGIANLGLKPTVSADDIYKGRIWLETFVFGYEGDAYGREIRVKLLRFIRPEKKFAGIEELREQLLGKDVEEARQFLAVYQEGRRHADEKTLVFSADK